MIKIIRNKKVSYGLLNLKHALEEICAGIRISAGNSYLE